VSARLAIVSCAALSACAPARVPVEGKRCSADHACPIDQGLVCNPFTGLCAKDARCPYERAPSIDPSCTGRDLYLAPDGDDARTGLSPAEARRTPPGLSRGDRIHLAPGRYGDAFTLSGNGEASCPFSLEGAPEFASVLEKALSVAGSHWRVKRIAVEARSARVALTLSPSGTFDLMVEEVRFSGTGLEIPRASGLAHIDLTRCVGCGIIASEFDAELPIRTLVGTGVDDLVFRGNTLRGTRTSFPVIDFTGRGPTIEALDIASGGIRIAPRLNGIVRRSVFHDLLPGTVAIDGASRVESNTFARVPGASLAATAGDVFANNIVSEMARGYGGSAPAGGGFNLFDQVQRPYADGSPAGTDVVADPALDMSFVPTSTSAAIDAADPRLPVPLGGGPRADIGALERGAAHRDDGTYCEPPS
jgi:hypothetical protein